MLYNLNSLVITLMILAVFRLTYMLTLEDGPGDVFVKFRTKVGCYNYSERTYPNGSPMPDTAIGRWFACPVCVALFPVSLLVLLMVLTSVSQLLILWLGISGGCTLLFRWRNW